MPPKPAAAEASKRAEFKRRIHRLRRRLRDTNLDELVGLNMHKVLQTFSRMYSISQISALLLLYVCIASVTCGFPIQVRPRPIRPSTARVYFFSHDRTRPARTLFICPHSLRERARASATNATHHNS